jgi:hypothetical protein
MNSLPVTILEADIRLYDGDEKYIGGCAENITLTDEYEQRKVEYPGVATAKRKKVDESHVIEIANLWLIDLSVDPPVVPDLDPDAVYELVIEWTDEDTGYRATRTYEGVTLRGDRITTPNQNLTFDAETVQNEAGA